MWKDIKCKSAILAIFILILRYTGPASVEAATSTAHVTLSAAVAPSSQLTLNNTSNGPNIKSCGNRCVSATQNSAGATATIRTGTTPATLATVWIAP
jgi:predicted secreted Zn-dependent protease